MGAVHAFSISITTLQLEINADRFFEAAPQQISIQLADWRIFCTRQRCPSDVGQKAHTSCDPGGPDECWLSFERCH